ncbi:MAG: type 4a pilus biogenesis protein PilO [Parcubacteria group bacterium]|nr:type 4a pilus biogenesis protein PilO [Parcubacteria group bacterium]
MFLRNFIITILSLAIIIGGPVFLLKPQSEKAYELWVRNRVSTEELKLKRQIQNQSQELSGALDQHKDEIENRLKIAIPKTLDKASLLPQFETLAASNGLNLGSVGFGKEETINASMGLKATSIDLTVSGNLPSFRKFLESLEQNLRIFDVNNFSFTAPAKTEDLMSFNLKMSVYFQGRPLIK